MTSQAVKSPTGFLASGSSVDRSAWLAIAVSWLFCLVLAISVSPHGKDLIAEQMVGKALLD